MYSTQLHISHQQLHFTPRDYRYIKPSVTHIPPTTKPHSTSLPLYTTLSYIHPTNKYTSLHMTNAVYSTQIHTSHQKLHLNPHDYRCIHTQLHTSHQQLHLTPPHYRYIQHSVINIPPTPTPQSKWLTLYKALNYTQPTNNYTSLQLTAAIYSTQLQISHEHLHLTHITAATYSTQLHTFRQQLRPTPPQYRYI